MNIIKSLKKLKLKLMFVSLLLLFCFSGLSLYASDLIIGVKTYENYDFGDYRFFGYGIAQKISRDFSYIPQTIATDRLEMEFTLKVIGTEDNQKLAKLHSLDLIVFGSYDINENEIIINNKLFFASAEQTMETKAVKGNLSDLPEVLNRNTNAIIELINNNKEKLSKLKTNINLSDKVKFLVENPMTYNNDAFLNFSKGFSRILINEFDEAISICESVTKSDFNFIENHEILGLAYERGKNETEKAYKAYTNMQTLASSINDAYYLIKSLIHKASIEISLKQGKNAIKTLSEAEKLAQTNNYTNLIAEIYETYSDYYLSIGETNETVAYLNKAYDKYYKETKQLHKAGETIINIGLVWKNIQNYEKAIENFQKALSIFQEGYNYQNRFDALFYIGETYAELKDFLEAEKYLMQALKIAQSSLDLELNIRALMKLGVVFSDQESFESAIEYEKTALELAQEIQHVRYAARINYNIATIYFKAKNHNATENHFEKAINEIRKLNSSYELNKMMFDIGTFFLEQGDFQSAYKYLKSAYDFFVEEQLVENAVMSAYYLSCVAQILGTGRQKENYTDAVKKYLTNNELLLKKLIINLYLVGYENYLQNQYDYSSVFFQKALEVSRLGGYDYYICLSAYHLGVTYFDADDLLEAEKKFSEVEKSIKSANNKELEANTHFYLGSIRYLNGKLDEAHRNFQEAIKIFKNFNDTRNLARTYKKISSIYYQSKDYKKAILEIEKSIKLYRTLNQTGDLADALYEKGKFLFETNNLAQSEKLFNEAKDFYQKSNQASGIADCLFFTALIEHQANKNEQALQTLSASFEKYKEAKNIKGMAEALFQIGVIYYRANSFENSVKILIEALTLVDVNAETELVMQIKHYMGKSYYSYTDFDNAVKLLSESLELATEIENLDYEADNRYFLGLSFMQLKDKTNAEKNLLTSLKLYKEINSDEKLPQNYYSLGIFYYFDNRFTDCVKILTEGLQFTSNENKIKPKLYYYIALSQEETNPAEAVNNLQSALQLFVNHNDNYFTSRVLYNLGQIFMSLNQAEKAADAFEKCKEYSETVENDLQFSFSSYYLGILYLKQKKVDVSIKNLNFSMEYFKKVDNKYQYANSLYYLGLAYSFKNNQKALDFLLEATEIFKNLNEAYNLYNCYKSLADVYENLGNTDKQKEYESKTEEINLE